MAKGDTLQTLILVGAVGVAVYAFSRNREGGGSTGGPSLLGGLQDFGGGLGSLASGGGSIIGGAGEILEAGGDTLAVAGEAAQSAVSAGAPGFITAGADVGEFAGDVVSGVTGTASFFGNVFQAGGGILRAGGQEVEELSVKTQSAIRNINEFFSKGISSIREAGLRKRSQKEASIKAAAERAKELAARARAAVLNVFKRRKKGGSRSDIDGGGQSRLVPFSIGGKTFFGGQSVA